MYRHIVLCQSIGANYKPYALLIQISNHIKVPPINNQMSKFYTHSTPKQLETIQSSVSIYRYSPYSIYLNLCNMSE